MKPRVSGWYVDVAGQKSGPHNVEQIRELLQQKRIQAEQRVFAEHELPRPGQPAGELSSLRILRVGELLDQYTDPALSLLDALQAAKGKSAAAKGNQQNAVAEDRNSPASTATTSAPTRLARGVKNPDRKPGLSPQIAIFVATALIAAVVVWGTIEMLKRSSTILPPPNATAAKGAEGIKATSVGEAAAPAPAAAPRMAPPVPAPAAQPISPTNTGFASRIKPHGFNRPLASMPNQGRPTPPSVEDREREERDAAEAKEREQHERDIRDAQDRGGGGGQPIDGDPNTPVAAPANPIDPNTLPHHPDEPSQAQDPNLNGN